VHGVLQSAAADRSGTKNAKRGHIALVLACHLLMHRCGRFDFWHVQVYAPSDRDRSLYLYACNFSGCEWKDRCVGLKRRYLF
jgi:hypothetical protein